MLQTASSIQREKLREKLHNKINSLHANRLKPSPAKVNKLKKEVDLEKKRNDNDPRVTQSMKNYFIEALRSYKTIEIPDPHTILENKEKYTLDYYNFCIKLLEKNNNNQEILDNPYCKYLKHVLNL